MIRANYSSIRQAALITVVAVSLGLGACATNNSGPGSPSNTPEGLYDIAKRALTRGDYLTAIDVFESLGAQFPFGNYTQKAQLEVTYAYYKQDEYDSAISAADRYIKLYPRDESVDYAIYMKALSNFSRGGSPMERFFPRQLAYVDQNWLRAAYVDFDTLVRRFPNSEYAADAVDRMAYLRDEMARHELITARYYYNRGAMVASVNRVTYLLEHYKGSKHVPNALALMASAQRSLGQTDLANDTLRVLAQTDPEHPAVQRL